MPNLVPHIFTFPKSRKFFSQSSYPTIIPQKMGPILPSGNPWTPSPFLSLLSVCVCAYVCVCVCVYVCVCPCVCVCVFVRLRTVLIISNWFQGLICHWSWPLLIQPVLYPQKGPVNSHGNTGVGNLQWVILVLQLDGATSYFESWRYVATAYFSVVFQWDQRLFWSTPILYRSFTW